MDCFQRWGDQHTPANCTNDNRSVTRYCVRNYSYDHANRLIQVTEGILTTQFAYNGDGVRVGKVLGGATTDYILDLAATLPVVISDTDAVYLYGLDIIAEQMSQGRMYYMHDGLGSVRQLTDQTGQIADSYAYDPFGVPLSGDGVPNPWRFTGEAWDAEVELLYLRARYYQPATGRFITTDPWPGELSRPRTLNPYVYVRNSPANYTDPSGLQGPYDPYESFMQAVGLARHWFTEEGKGVQRFGPNEPLTMDVRHSRGVQDFKQAWAEEGEYRVPWTWDKQSIDVREGAPLVLRLVWGAKTFARAQWNLFRCAIGRGSPTPEGQVDPVIGILGSFNVIAVYLSPEGGTEMLTFEVYNVMGRRSFLRLKGTHYSPLTNVERGESGGWGGHNIPVLLLVRARLRLPRRHHNAADVWAEVAVAGTGADVDSVWPEVAAAGSAVRTAGQIRRCGVQESVVKVEGTAPVYRQ